MKSKGLRTLLV